MANRPKGTAGALFLQKISGSGAVANGTQYYIPVTGVQISDPENVAYVPMMNKDMFLANAVKGQRTASISFQTLLKSSYCIPALFASLTGSFDSGNDADIWAICVLDGSTGGAWTTTILDGCKLMGMSISHSAAGGGIGVGFSFLAQNASGTTSFTTTGNPDAGFMLDSSMVDYGGSATADLVDGWNINLMRAQAYDQFTNPGLYIPAGISSGQLGGTLTLSQSPLYSISPTATFTIRLGPNGSPLMTITNKVNLDANVRNLGPSLGSHRREYTLVNLSTGGNPCIFS
jgi:hypothetical protein